MLIDLAHHFKADFLIDFGLKNFKMNKKYDAS